MAKSRHPILYEAERFGYALVGLGALVGDAVGSLGDLPDGLRHLGNWTVDASKRIPDGYARLTKRGKHAWPRVVRSTERAVRESKETVVAAERKALARTPGIHPTVSEDMTLAELRDLARDLDLPGRSKMGKAELVSALRERV